MIATVGFDPGPRHEGAVLLLGDVLAATQYVEVDPRDRDRGAPWVSAHLTAFALCDILEALDPSATSEVVLGIESAAYSLNGNQIGQLHCARQAFVSACHEYLAGLDLQPRVYAIAPNTAKLALAGHGKASKHAMVTMARAQYGDAFHPAEGLFTKANIPRKKPETLADALGVAIAAQAKHRNWLIAHGGARR